METKQVKSSKFKKKYKALMLDVDGTTVRNEHDAMPSKKVKEAINKAGKIIKIGLATSRPLWHVKHIISELELKSPCIITGGGQIFDPKKNKIIWEKLIEYKDIELILKTAEKLGIQIFDDENSKSYFNKKIKKLRDYEKRGPVQFWSPSLSEKLCKNFLDKLSEIKSISAVEIPSWRTNSFDILISHAEATKQHGILEVAKLLNISTYEMIGVGDGYNDFPLLMACGLKVAMGNAVEDLKEIADYIAPTVDEDGVAQVIEKFVL